MIYKHRRGLPGIGRTRPPASLLGAVLLALAVAATPQLEATVYNVGGLTDLQNAINAALPGDQIILANGVYPTTNVLTISCAGTATQPVLITAQTIGGAQITGQYGFNFIGANYVILQGFYFTYTNANVTGGLIVDPGSAHCRITQNTFYDDPIQYWCFIEGDDTEVDHNLFANKVDQGEYVTLDGNHTTLQIAQRLWVHDNDFYNNEYYALTGGNGGESTRLGVGTFEESSAWSVVENNLYNQANGDPEAISVKCADNVIRYNTLTNSLGEFNLRAQLRGRIEGNFLIHAGGIRFYDDDDFIFNNYLQGVTNGIVFGSGEEGEIAPSTPDDGQGVHAATHRARVEFNTLVNCQTYFDADNRGDDPEDCIVANNLLQGSSGYFVSSQLSGEQTDFTWQTNIFYGGASYSYSPAGSYLNLNPQLPTNTAPPYHITAASPALGASFDAPPEVVFDMDGQPRPAVPAIGADEYATAPIIHHPLGTNDVGPYVAATNFDVAAMPWSQTVMPGEGTAYNVLLSAFNGFTNPVTLSLGSLPPGASASFNQNTISNGFGFSVLTVTTADTTPPGRYTIVITATSATFTNSTIACLTVGNLPANWTDQDIGQPALQGSADNYLGVYAVRGGGTNTLGAADQFNFASAPWTNAVMLTARLTTESPVSPGTQSGVMIRESTNAGSKYVDLVITPGAFTMNARGTTGGGVTQLASYAPASLTDNSNYVPNWVSLALYGNTFAAYASTDGLSWLQMGTTNLSLTNTLVGLAVCACVSNYLNTSTFDNVSALPPPSANYNLSHWCLDLPVDASGLLSGTNDATNAPLAVLNSGYASPYFYLATNGAMVCWAPVTGATTADSMFPRSELREVPNPTTDIEEWTGYGAHFLSVQDEVLQVPASGEIIIGQIKTAGQYPVAEIKYTNGFVLGIVKTNETVQASDDVIVSVSAGLSNRIAYSLQMVNGLVTIAINGVTNSLNAFQADPDWATNVYNFKAGSYCQDNTGTADEGGRVALSGINAWHQPVITNPPASTVVTLGTNATLNVGAIGNGTLTYQWWFNGTLSLAGDTNASLTVSNLSPASLGNYTVVVSDSLGSVTSSVAVLTTNSAPVITTQPASQSVSPGGTATLTVGVSGTAPLIYQWWFKATNSLAGATNAALSIPNFQATNAGTYLVVVSNSFGVATSSAAMLSFNPPMGVTNFATPGTWTWLCPSNVSSVQVQCWGGGGAGGGASRNGQSSGNATGGGGAGGAYALKSSYPVIPGDTYYINVGAGGIDQMTNSGEFPGGDSWFNTTNSPSTNILAKGGGGGETVLLQDTTTRHGAGGTNQSGSVGDVVFAGGIGGTPTGTSYGGSGGGSGGTNAVGNAGDPASGLGATNVLGGGNGGNANTSSGSGPGQAPTLPPGGGGGGARCASSNTTFTGGTGAAGQVILTYYTAPTVTASPATGIGLTTATLNGNALDNGNAITERGFFYQTSSGVTTNGAKITAGAGAGPFTATAFLSPNTNYYWRAYALNAGGLVLSSELNFQTSLPPPPSFTGVSFSANHATLALSGTGAVNQAYVLLTAPSLSPPVTWTPLVTNTAGTNGSFSFTDAQVTNAAQRFYQLTTP